MIRRFARDAVVYGLAGVLVRGLNFLLLPLYARSLSADEIGVVDVLAIVIGFAQVTVALEVAQGFARHYVEASDDASRERLASTAYVFTFASFTLFAVVGLAGTDAITTYLLHGAGAGAVRIAIAVAWLGGLVQLALNEMRYQLRAAAYAVVSVASVAITVVAVSFFVVVEHAGPAGAFAGQAVGSALGLVVAIRARSRPLKLNISRLDLHRMLRFSLPLVPSSVGVLVLISIDRLTIDQVMTLADVGAFGVAYRLAQFVGLLVAGVQLALTPLIYLRYQAPETPGDLARLFRYFVAAALIVWVLVSTTAVPLLALLATDRYASVGRLVALLVPSILLANSYVFAPGLTLSMKTRVSAGVNLAGALVNTLLNAVLVRQIGLAGAAIATVIATGLVFAGTMYFSNREYPVPYGWRRLGMATGVTAGVVAAVELLPTSGPAQLVTGVLALVTVVGVCVASGLVRRSELALAVASVRGWRPT